MSRKANRSNPRDAPSAELGTMTKPLTCDWCGEALERPRLKQRFCSGGRCRDSFWAEARAEVARQLRAPKTKRSPRPRPRWQILADELRPATGEATRAAVLTRALELLRVTIAAE